MQQPAPSHLPPFPWIRKVLLPVVLALVLGALLLPIDRVVADGVRDLPIRGDLKRQLQFLQEFGGVGALVVVSIVIALLDPARLRRVLDWVLAAGLGALLFNAMKIATGRHRPDEGLETRWLGPLGRFDFESDGTLERPIEFWREGVFENLSMPSTHTTHAAIAAVFLVHLYPPLRWLCWPLVAITAFARVFFGSHWPSDVVVGAGLGVALGHLVVNRYWGVRLLDEIWTRFVDRAAEPALERARRTDLERWRT